MSAALNAPGQRWHWHIGRRGFLPREVIVVQWVLSQTLERTPARPRCLVPNVAAVADCTGIREDHCGRVLDDLRAANVLVLEEHHVKVSGRRRVWTRIGVLPVEQWNRAVREPAKGALPLDSAEVLALETWLGQLDPDGQLEAADLLPPPSLRSLLLEWNLPMGQTGVLPMADRTGHVGGEKLQLSKPAGDQGLPRTDIGRPLSRDAAGAAGETPRHSGSGGGAASAEKNPVETLEEHLARLGAKFAAGPVPDLGTTETSGAAVLAAEYPKKVLGDPNLGTSEVPDLGTRPRAQAVASSGSIVQELAKASTAAIERMAKLSPAEWARFAHIWQPVAEKRPRALLKLLDDMEAEIARRESGTSPEDPIMRPLAWLYRSAEDAGLVPRRKKLRTIK